MATATGTLTKLRISEQFKQGFSLGAGPGGVCFAPTRTTDKILDGAIALGDSAMLFANSDVATSTILRPTPTGAESLTVLNSSAAPQSFSWNVNPGPGRQLTTLPDGSIAIVNPHPTEPAGDDAAFAADTQTALVNAGLDQLEPNVTEPSGVTALANAIGNTPAELTKAHNDFARAQNQTLDEVIFTIPRPWAIDAAGQSVPVALSTQGNTLTMTLSPSATAQYPIVADPAPTASAAKRGAPMRLMTFNTRSARPRDDSPDNGDPTYSLHVTHARRVSNVIWHQVGSNSHDRRVPSVVGVQEMCKSDLDIIVEDLNTRDAGTNTLWRADFRRFRSANGCPIGTTDNPGGNFGNAIIRNVNLTSSPVSARYPTPFQLNEKRSDGMYRYERRGYIHDKVDVRGRTFDFFTTHLVVQDDKNSSGDSRTVKQNQSQFLLDQIDGITNPRVATGDFNSLTSAAPSINVYRYWPDAGFHDVDRCGMRSGDTPRVNCAEGTTASGARIDYIFQKGLTINSSNVANVNDETSDHDTLVSSASIP